ncbi:glycosyltransferase family 4 protein [Halopiger thermotolerans]
MKVSYVVPFYTSQCDGRYGRFHDWIHTLRDTELADFEFDVHAIISPNPDNTLASSPLEVLGDGNELWATKRNNIESIINIPRIYRELHRSEPDIIHLVASEPLLLAPILLAAQKTPLVIGPNIGGWYPNRNDDIWISGSIPRFKQTSKFWLRKQFIDISDYDVILSFSDYHREMLSTLGISKENITILHPGVSPIFSPKRNKNKGGGDTEILYVGDLSSHKGYDVFLRSLTRLDREFHARIIGTGNPDRELIQRLGISDQVTIEGYVARENLPEYYQSADLFVIPSIDEMGPNTQVEALATGTPIVTTDSPGLDEYPPHDAAVFFWPRDTESLSDALHEAIDNIGSLTDSALAHSSEFRVEKTVNQLTDIYREIV